jgi:hypothetical protein
MIPSLCPLIYTFARSALWSHAHRVGTTFALDWSKAREARVEDINLTIFYLKAKGKSKS